MKINISKGNSVENGRDGDIGTTGSENKEGGGEGIEKKAQEVKMYEYEELYEVWVNSDPVLKKLKESQIEEFAWPFDEMKLLFGKYVDQRCATNEERKEIFNCITSISNESMLNQRLQQTILCNIDNSEKEGIVEKVKHLVEVANTNYRDILVMDR